jgi:hypothetical protein
MSVMDMRWISKGTKISSSDGRDIQHAFDEILIPKKSLLGIRTCQVKIRMNLGVGGAGEGKVQVNVPVLSTKYHSTMT